LVKPESVMTDAPACARLMLVRNATEMLLRCDARGELCATYLVVNVGTMASSGSAPPGTPTRDVPGLVPVTVAMGASLVPLSRVPDMDTEGESCAVAELLRVKKTT